MLIFSYENTTSTIKDIPAAVTEAAKTVTDKNAKCLKIALKLNNFVTDKRLNDYGLDLPYYAARWWSDEDTVVALIYAEVQNSLDLATWDATTVSAISSADSTYTKLDKPKKALRFAVKVLTDLSTFTWTTNATQTANAIDTTSAGELVKKGFTVADLTRHGITEARAKVLQTYIANYKTTESLAQDVLDTPKANGNANLDTDAKKIREIVLYQNQVYPDQKYRFSSVYLDFAAVGLSRRLITSYFNEHLLVAEEWNRILTAAQALAAQTSFPSTAQIAYGFKTAGGVSITALNVATTIGKSQLAGLVAVYEYLNSYENLDSNRYVTPEELDQYGFDLLLDTYEGLTEEDKQAWYALVNAEIDLDLSIEDLYTAAKVTQATVGTLTEEQLIGRAAFEKYEAANATRDFTKTESTKLTTADVRLYGIDFGKYEEDSWYTTQDLTEILSLAKQLASFTSGNEVIFTNEDLIAGNFGDEDLNMTDKQRAGQIAFRLFDEERREEAAAAGVPYKYVDESVSLPAYDFRTAGYDQDSFAEFNLAPEGIIAQGIGFVKGQNDGFVAIEIAKFLVFVYNTDSKMNTLKSAVGSTATSSEWTALGTDLNKKAGAIAGHIVNRKLHALSQFTFTDAALFGVASLSVADNDKPKTEWFLAEAKARYMSMRPITEAEELVIEAQLIADFGTTITLEQFSQRQLIYALIKGTNAALPADPVPGGSASWVAFSTSGSTVVGDSLTYGVYSLPMMYPSLYLSSVSSNNTARNAIFASIKAKMTATGSTLTLNQAATAALADYLVTDKKFKKDQRPLEYSSADVTKYLATFATSFDNKSTNNIMDIAVKNITTGILGGTTNYYVASSTAGAADVQNPLFTTYA